MANLTITPIYLMMI